MHPVQLICQYCKLHTSDQSRKERPPARPGSGHLEGEKAMNLTTVMIEWSAIAIALYTMIAVASPALGTN